MRRLLVLSLAALALTAAPARAASPPPVDARAYVIVDGRSGDVLAARSPHAEMPIASITKLMTILVALHHLKLSQVVTVAPSAAAVGESSIDLRAGEQLTVHDLLEGALIQSANDAADALAAAASNGNVDTFVRAMNAKARALHLRDTHFARPDGLDAPGAHSSASDVTRLARIVMRIPAVRDIVRRRTATIAGGRTLHTWNDLLGVFPGIFGVKTGHTDGAGWCQVAAVRRPGYTVYVTILGSPSRDVRNTGLAALLRWGVSRYRVASVIARGRTYAVTEVGYGRAPLRLVAAAPARRAVLIDRPLVARVVSTAAASLPVRAGTRLGTLRVFQANRLVAARPLVATRAVERPSLVARVRFYARRTADHVWGWIT